MGGGGGMRRVVRRKSGMNKRGKGVRHIGRKREEDCMCVCVW